MGTTQSGYYGYADREAGIAMEGIRRAAPLCQVIEEHGKEIMLIKGETIAKEVSG